MGMTLSAADGQAHPDAARCVDAIGQVLKTSLLLVHTRFGVAGGVAMKAGGNELSGVRIRQQITRELLNRELIVWQIAIDGVDDPIPKAPRILANLVPEEAITVGVAGGIKPVASPALAKVR